MSINKTDKQEEFELTITADSVVSTDERFTMDDLTLGYEYEPLDAYFKGADNTIIKRSYRKSEHRISNQTIARIAFQVFEKQIIALSDDDKRNFPICKYTPSGETICGIYSSVEEIKKSRNNNSNEFMVYHYDNDRREFVIYCWGIFTTVIFVQECLKRFGKPGDKFVLKYRHKTEEEKYGGNRFSSMLIEAKNLILHGAPGTGKTYLAKEIAADIVSDGYFNSYQYLTPKQKEQIEFVQFHPSYDYSDFVEGLRPKVNKDGTIGFELRDGIFKSFAERAAKDISNKYIFIIDEINRGEISKIFGELFFSIDPGYRGAAGEISTQYANLHQDPNKKFYVPENLYIIGTMNDIDRSVDSFDFAMRRRFRFVELKADERRDMLYNVLDEEKAGKAIRCMDALNNEIADVEDLNESYQIGPAYFLKLDTLDFDKLWTDHLQPLLREYVQGMYDEESIMSRFEKAYKEQAEGDINEALEN